MHGIKHVLDNCFYYDRGRQRSPDNHSYGVMLGVLLRKRSRMRQGSRFRPGGRWGTSSLMGVRLRKLRGIPYGVLMSSYAAT